MVLKGLEELFKHQEERRWRESLPLSLRSMVRVYGGFYGEKLSYDSPKEVWEGFRKSGVSQIIDLRYDYPSEKFKARCEKYDIRYFSYPVHNDPETIASMVEKFYDFSDLLSEGHFYMHGRTNSEIALCIYWALGSNNGLYPLELRQRIMDDEDVMKKALPILNAIVKYKVDHAESLAGDKSYMDSLVERVKDFKISPYPPKVWYSIFDFIRAFRNVSVVYDISVTDLGVVGYMYPSSHRREGWEYDIILRPSVSGEASSFADAQLEIVQYLCQIIPQSIKYPALPESTKMVLGLLKASLDK